MSKRTIAIWTFSTQKWCKSFIPVLYMEDHQVEKANENMKDIETRYQNLQEFVNKEGFIEPLDDPFKKIGDFFDKVGTFANKIGDAFNKVFGGVGKIFNSAMVEEPAAISKGIGIGFRNINQLLIWSVEWITSYITCGVYFLSNFQNCFLYWFADTIAQTFYSIGNFIIWMISGLIGMDLTNKFVKPFWEGVYKFDARLFVFTGFHIAKWNVSVRNLCYNCRRLKDSALSRKAAEVKYNFETKLPSLIRDAAKGIYDGSDDVKHAFDVFR